MSFRKIKADRIFDGFRFRDDHVLILSEDGYVEDLVPVADGGSDIEHLEGILSPGFINCHCHLELSHMKGLIPEGTGLVDFVFKVVTERHHSTEEILSAIEHAENEMLQNGIVAVGDICNNPLTLPQKQKARLRYYNFIEASGWLPSVSGQRFQRAKELADQFSILHSPFSISPHAPYSVSEELWQRIQPHFANKTVTVHNQETLHEDAFFREGAGDFLRMYQLMKIDNSHHQPTAKSSVRSYFDKLKGADSIILVHNTFTNEDDVHYIREQISESNLRTYFCFCPNANRYIENAVPDIEMFRRNNCTIVLGTDSLASNWSLSILDEMKSIQKSFPSIPLDEMLRWATSNGAQALQMENELGSFEKGKRPGVLLIDAEGKKLRRLTW